MAQSDRARWNDRYRREGYDFTPSVWLRELEPTLRQHPVGARALDLACGGGRNALYLAQLGYLVDAWDVSEVGLEFLRHESERRASTGQPLAIQPRRVDLERSPLPPAAYDLILDAHYLERALFPSMRHALRRGGLLIVNTFLWEPGRPLPAQLTNPSYALQPGELRAAFGDLEIVSLVEDTESGHAQLVARATG
jgi:tellurite methyltransferase